MNSSFKMCITGNFSDFAVRSLLSAGGPNIMIVYLCTADRKKKTTKKKDTTEDNLKFEPLARKLIPYAKNKDADESAHPRSLISTCVVHYLDSIIHTLSKFKISSLKLVSVAEQTGLSLTWLHSSEGRFSRDVAHWTTTRQNQQNMCAPSKDSDQPGHLPILIRVFALRMKKAWAILKK